MKQSFDDVFEENYGFYIDDRCKHRYENSKEFGKAMYDAGEKSRQAEVDELKATIVKYEAGLRKNKANKHKLLAKNIELQKWIDGDLIQVSNHYHSCVARKNLKIMSASISEIAEIEAHESNMAVLENILKGNKDE